MNLRKTAAVFAIVVGLMIFGQWTAFIALGEVDELDTEPVRISFHLAAEFLTAAALIAAGYGLLSSRDWAFPLYMVSLGMLSYTIVVSPGYFAQEGELVFVGMFAVLWLLTIVFLVAAFRNERELRGENAED